MYEIIIKNGLIIDGSGKDPYIRDIGISGGKIAYIGKCRSDSEFIVDAEGKIVSPGFIDAHTHSEIPLLIDGSTTTALQQGCTTLCVGNCGNSNFPIVDKNREYYEDLISKEFQFSMETHQIYSEQQKLLTHFFTSMST